MNLVFVFVCAAVIFSLGILTGCVVAPPVKKDSPKRELKIYGSNVSPEQFSCILRALDYLPEAVRSSVEEIHIRSDIEHFEYFYLGSPRYAAAHNCTYGGRKICLRPERVNLKMVWHEMGHVYTLTLKFREKFLKEWGKIAGNVYVSNYEDYVGANPCEGMLTWYSRKNAVEDIAEWVEECLDYLYLNRESPVFKNVNFKTDKRYRQKLAYLYEHGLFSKEDYEKLKPLFE